MWRQLATGNHRLATSTLLLKSVSSSRLCPSGLYLICPTCCPEAEWHILCHQEIQKSHLLPWEALAEESRWVAAAWGGEGAMARLLHQSLLEPTMAQLEQVWNDLILSLACPCVCGFNLEERFSWALKLDYSLHYCEEVHPMVGASDLESDTGWQRNVCNQLLYMVEIPRETCHSSSSLKTVKVEEEVLRHLSMVKKMEAKWRQWGMDRTLGRLMEQTVHFWMAQSFSDISVLGHLSGIFLKPWSFDVPKQIFLKCSLLNWLHS